MLKQGNSVAFMGQKGCGKSTTLLKVHNRQMKVSCSELLTRQEYFCISSFWDFQLLVNLPGQWEDKNDVERKVRPVEGGGRRRRREEECVGSRSLQIMPA